MSARLFALFRSIAIFFVYGLVGPTPRLVLAAFSFTNVRRVFGGELVTCALLPTFLVFTAADGGIRSSPTSAAA